MMSSIPNQDLPCNVVVGFGNDGAVLQSHVLTALDRIGASSTLVAYGHVNGDRVPIGVAARHVRRGQALDITLPPSDLHRIREDRSDASSRSDVTPHVLAEFWERLLKVMPPSAPIYPQLLGCAGLDDIETIAPSLSQLKARRLPHLSITLCVRWPEPGHDGDRALAGLKPLYALLRDRHIDGVHLYHPRSALARSVGEDVQTHMVAGAEAAFLAAPGMERQNKALAEVSRSIGTLEGTGMRGTFACMAVDVARVAEGTQSGFSGLLRWSGKPDVGYGDMRDCVQQATSLATRLLEDEQTRTFAAPFDATLSPFELLFVVPFPHADPRFPRIVSQLRAWQTATVPAAGTPLVVSGSGRLPQHERGRYYCLVAYLFPIADALVLPTGE